MSEEQIEECGCVNFECRCSVDAIRAQLAAKSAEAERLREAVEMADRMATVFFHRSPYANQDRECCGAHSDFLDHRKAALAPRAEKPAGEGPGVIEVESIYRRAPSKED